MKGNHNATDVTTNLNNYYAPFLLDNSYYTCCSMSFVTICHSMCIMHMTFYISSSVEVCLSCHSIIFDNGLGSDWLCFADSTTLHLIVSY